MKKSPYQKHWWDDQVIRLVIYINRNDLVWVGVFLALAVLYAVFPVDWNANFGLR